MMDTAATATASGAIAAALSQNWKEAIRINKLLVAAHEKDIDALNRLGFAYARSGRASLARSIFKRVLAIDPYNQIAHKHLGKLAHLTRKDPAFSSSSTVSPSVFLEEPGKTKIVEAVNLAPAPVLSRLSPGMEVNLKLKSYCFEIRSATGEYIGALPDDISYKLRKLIQCGYKYQAVVRRAEKKLLVVLLREIARGNNYARQPSFSTPLLSVLSAPYASDKPEVKPNTAPTGEIQGQED